MAREVELKIIADSSKFTEAARDVQKETKRMGDAVNQQQHRQKGLIEDTAEALKRYEKAQKEAYDEKALVYYNRKIAEAKHTLKEYNKAGLEVAATNEKIEKSGKSIGSMFGRMVTPLLAVTAAIAGFKKAMEATEKTSHALKVSIAGVKAGLDELWRSIATGNMKDLAARMKEAAAVGRDYADTAAVISDRERELNIIESRRQIEMAKLAKVYRNTALTGAEGYKLRKEAAEKYIELAEQGEKEAIELLNIRLSNEMKVARQMMGLTEEYEKASDAEKKAIDERVQGYILSAKAFDENKDAIKNYQALLKDLEDAEKGVIETRRVGDDMILVRGEKDIKRINELKAAIAGVSPEIVKMSDDYEKFGLVTVEVRQKIADGMIAINNQMARTEKATIRATVMAEMATGQAIKESEKVDNQLLKNAEKLASELEKLWTDYAKATIGSMSGMDRIKAEEAYTLQLIDERQKMLEELGELDENAYKMLQALRDKAHADALASEAEFTRLELEERRKAFEQHISQREKLNDLEMELELQALELSGRATEEKRLEIEKRFTQRKIEILNQLISEETDAQKKILLEKNKELLEGVIKQIENEVSARSFNLWEALGVTDKRSQREMDRALLGAVQDVSWALDSIYNQRVEDARRTRELYDDNIKSLQKSIDQEIELAKIGYANNVDARKKQLEEMEQQRQKALQAEEKAVKAQQQFDSIQQLTAMVTASANIFKALSKLGPVGVAVAIASIASMFTAFAAVKTKAATATKLAAGGYGDDRGVVTGRRHSQGGERFLDHVEVEKGEMWGVLNRRATAKYGRQFGEIVNNFNRDNLTIERPNNIIVDINQTNSRLDKVEYQLIKLNSHFMGQDKITETATMRIERRGNKTRIIRK